MSRNVIETVMGGVVLLIAGGFLVTAYEGRKASDVTDGYVILAQFDDASGIVTGSDVRVGGVKVGVVDSMGLDNKTYRAQIRLKLGKELEIPEDSSAAIKGDGLLGSKFVSLEPGGSDAFLKEGGEIEFTQSSVSLEEMIGKFVFSGGGVEGEGAAKSNEESAVDAPVSPPAAEAGASDSEIDLTIP